MNPNRSIEVRHRYRPAGRFATNCFNGLLAVLFGCLWSGPAAAQSAVTPEHTVKVAYLYNFIRYVQWPETAFVNETSPFVIGLLDSDPHGHLLDRIAKRKLARDRKIEIRRFNSVKNIEGCHLVFLSASVGAAAEAYAIAMTETQNVLLVCDTTSATPHGAPIRFYHDQDGTIGLAINIAAMERRALKADAKLLTVATVVRD